MKEDKIIAKKEREKHERSIILALVKIVTEKETDREDEIEEVIRLGKYVEGQSKSMKIKFMSQAAPEETLNSSWRLGKVEEHKNTWVRKDTSEDERKKTSELRKEVKEKKMEWKRKRKFYWEVRGIELKKWWIAKEGTMEKN